MKKHFKSLIVFMLFYIIFSAGPSYSGTAEVETLFNESVAAIGVYDQALSQNPVTAVNAADVILKKFKLLSAEDQAAYAQKVGMTSSDEVVNNIQVNFIDRAYQKHWDTLCAEWADLMQQKKYDDAKKLASQVNNFLYNTAGLPPISPALLANFKDLSKKGVDAAAAHNDASAAIAELSGLYTEKKYVAAIEKLQQYKKKADETPDFADALKKLVPEAADLDQFCKDLLKTAVKDYAADQVKKYQQLIGEGKMKEASKLAEETSEFLKNNPQAKAVADAEYGIDSVMVCERAAIDSFFQNNQELKNAAEMFPEFKAAVDKYNQLAAAKDYVGAAKLASEWAKKCQDDPNFKGVNAASGGALLDICKKGVELALLTGIDEARKNYIEAYQKGDMVSAKQTADAVAKVLSDFPEYKDIINKKLGGDWEKIAKEASAATAKEIAARDAKIAVLAETYRQIAGLYSAEVSVNGTVSVLARTFNQALNEFARQNAQYIAEIEKVSGIKLDSLIGVSASGAPAQNNDGSPAAGNDGQQQNAGQNGQATDGQQPPAGQSGTPPVTNQTDGTNQNINPFTNGSGN
jgi:hypothetical protein